LSLVDRKSRARKNRATAGGQIVAQGIAHVGWIAADADAVYYVGIGDGGIFRVSVGS